MEEESTYNLEQDSGPDKNTQKRLNDLELKLLAQEHRVIAVWVNFFKALLRPRDKRRLVATGTAVFHFFFSPFTFAVGGGIVAYFTLIAIVDQNAQIAKQTEEMEIQNNLQEMQYDNQRITELTEILYDPDYTTSKRRLKSEALVEYITIKRKNRQPIDLSGVELSGVKISNQVSYSGIDFTSANFSEAILDSVYFPDCEFLMARFNSATITDVIFNGSNFRLSEFSSTNEIMPTRVLGCYFRGCDLSFADFSSARLSFSHFDGAFFYSNKMDNALLVLNEEFDSAFLSSFVAFPYAVMYGQGLEDFQVIEEFIQDSVRYCISANYDVIEDILTEQYRDVSEQELRKIFVPYSDTLMNRVFDEHVVKL